MATMIDKREEGPDADDVEQPVASFPTTSADPVWRGVLAVLKVLASLKITV